MGNRVDIPTRWEESRGNAAASRYMYVLCM